MSHFIYQIISSSSLHSVMCLSSLPDAIHRRIAIHTHFIQHVHTMQDQFPGLLL